MRGMFHTDLHIRQEVLVLQDNPIRVHFTDVGVRHHSCDPG